MRLFLVNSFLILIILGCKSNLGKQQNDILLNGLPLLCEISKVREINSIEKIFKTGKFTLILHKRDQLNASNISKLINHYFSKSDGSESGISTTNGDTEITVKIPLDYIRRNQHLNFIAEVQAMPMDELNGYKIRYSKNGKVGEIAKLVLDSKAINNEDYFLIELIEPSLRNANMIYSDIRLLQESTANLKVMILSDRLIKVSYPEKFDKKAFRDICLSIPLFSYHYYR